jgi:drug/metabolite transporter (DMT)-like permease
MFAAFLTTVLFSLSVIFASRTTRVLGGTRANFYRLCLSTVLLAIWAHVFGRGTGGAAFWWFFVSGCIGFGVGDIALYQSIPRLGPRLAVLLVQCGAAPVGALTEWLWMGTTLTLTQMASGAVILVGVALALAPREHLHIAPSALVWGIVLGIVAALGQGAGAVVSRKAFAVAALAGQDIDGLTATYQRILGGLAFSIPPALWVMRRSRASGGAGTGVKVPNRTVSSPTLWRWVLLNSLAGPTLGVGCYQWALKTTPSGIVLPIVATTPIVVIPFSWLMEGDRPSLRSVLGGLLAVAGAVALTFAR